MLSLNSITMWYNYCVNIQPPLHTHIHMSQIHARLFHFFYYRNISQSPLMFTTTHLYSSRKCLTGWTMALFALTIASASDVRRGRGSFTYTAAIIRYCITNSFSHPFEYIHASSAIMPSINHHHRQNHNETYSHGNWNHTATTISRGSLCANVPQVSRPSACTEHSQRNQHHLETIKMGRWFLCERPAHTSGQEEPSHMALCE